MRQGLQHFVRDRHCADDRQDEEGDDDRMVYRRLAGLATVAFVCGTREVSTAPNAIPR